MKNTLIFSGFTLLALAAASPAARAGDIPAAPLIEGDPPAVTLLADPTWEHTLAQFKQKWGLDNDGLAQIKALIVEEMSHLADLRRDGMLSEDARKEKEHEIIQAARQKILHVVLVSLVKNKGALQGVVDSDWQHTRSRGPW